jgi:hypothetical protein
MQITTIGLDLAKNVFQVRRHDLHLMPHRDKFSGPKMGCAASFHSDEAGREPREVSSIPTWRPCLAFRAPLSTGRLRLRRPCWRRAQVAIRHRGIQDRATRPPGESLPGCRDSSALAAALRTVLSASRRASVRTGTAVGPISPSALAAAQRTALSASRRASVRTGTAAGPIFASASAAC